MTFEEWWHKERNTLTAVNPSARDGVIRAWNNYRGEKIRKQQARIDALEEMLRRWVASGAGKATGLPLVDETNDLLEGE